MAELQKRRGDIVRGEGRRHAPSASGSTSRTRSSAGSRSAMVKLAVDPRRSRSPSWPRWPAWGSWWWTCGRAARTATGSWCRSRSSSPRPRSPSRRPWPRGRAAHPRPRGARAHRPRPRGPRGPRRGPGRRAGAGRGARRAGRDHEGGHARSGSASPATRRTSRSTSRSHLALEALPDERRAHSTPRPSPGPLSAVALHRPRRRPGRRRPRAGVWCPEGCRPRGDCFA